MIPAGELNTWSSRRLALVEDFARRQELKSVRFEQSPAIHFGQQVDHIYYRGLIPLQSRVIQVKSSDHHPLVVTFRAEAGAMKNYLAGLLLGLATALPLQAATMEQEIRHLLDFVERSGCEFERNGTVHDSVEARAHIERKYDYIKERVKSTEDFIRYAASQSSMSGRKYHAICDGKTITSEEWLTEELRRFRKQSD